MSGVQWLELDKSTPPLRRKHPSSENYREDLISIEMRENEGIKVKWGGRRRRIAGRGLYLLGWPNQGNFGQSVSQSVSHIQSVRVSHSHKGIEHVFNIRDSHAPIERT